MKQTDCLSLLSFLRRLVREEIKAVIARILLADGNSIDLVWSFRLVFLPIIGPDDLRNPIELPPRAQGGDSITF